MAGTVDLYKRRTMIRALEQMKLPKTFLLNTFFNFASAQIHDTENIDIDIYKEKRRMAEFQNWKLEGKLVEKRGYSTETYIPGYIKPKMVTTADDLLRRQLGSTVIYGTGDSPLTFAAKKVGEDLAELRNIITRKLEWMASQVLQTGKVLISGDGISDRYIDFKMAATHIITLTTTAKWTNAASDPLKNIRTWRRLIAQESGINANICVMGSDVTDAFLDNTKVKAFLDNRRIEIGSISPRDLGNGVNYIATIEGVEYYTYDEWYWDTGSSSEKPMVPADGLILGSSNAYTAVHFGLIRDLEAPAAMAFFPKSWEEKDPSVRFVMLQSAPIVAMHQSDAFVFVTPI